MVDGPDDFDKIFNAAYGDDAGSAEDATQEPPVVLEPALETAEPSAEEPAEPKKRDDKGRFKTAAKAAPTQARGEPEEGAPAGQDEETAPEAKPAPEYATGRLTAEEKAVLGTLPDDAQSLVKQVLARQDAAHTKRMQEIAKTRTEYAALNDVLEQNRTEWRKNGLSDQQALKNLLAVEQAFVRDPSGTLKWLATQYGVTAPVENRGNGSTDTASKEVSAPQSFDSETIRKLVLEQTQQVLKPIMARQQEEQLNQMEQLTQKFQAEHQYRDFLPLVESQVPAFIQLEQRMNPNGTPMEWLDAATTKALWANEQTKAILLDAALKEQREKLLGSNQGRVSKAKLAAKSVIGAPAPNIRKEGPLDLDEIISQALSGQGI